MAQTDRTGLVFLRRKKVEARTGLSRSTIYQYMKDGMFPKPVPIGLHSVGWIEAEIEAWMRERVAAARSEEAAGSQRGTR